MSDQPEGYRATPKLERELAEKCHALIRGGRYAATIVYGRLSSTLEGALDNLEERLREAAVRSAAS